MGGREAKKDHMTTKREERNGRRKSERRERAWGKNSEEEKGSDRWTGWRLQSTVRLITQARDSNQYNHEFK